MWKCFSFMTMCLRFHHVCASALLMLWSSPHAPATREKSKTSAEVHNGCAGSLAHLFAKSILFLEQMCQGASTRSKTIHLDPVRSIPQRHWAPRAPPPLSGVLAFSHPLREQHASRSWDWHLTCSCRANGIHQAHHADCFERMPEGASTGARMEPSISSSNLHCALGLPLQRRTGKNVMTPFRETTTQVHYKLKCNFL